MDTVYDNIAVIGGTSVAPQSISGSSAVDGADVNTTGYASAELYAYGASASGSPTAATLTVKLQESSDNSTWSDALDNTSTVIGFTLNVHGAAAENAARIEGLNLNRKTYLRAVITPSFTSGTSPASVAFAQIILGAATQKPVDSTVSNT